MNIVNWFVSLFLRKKAVSESSLPWNSNLTLFDISGGDDRGEVEVLPARVLPVAPLPSPDKNSRASATPKKVKFGQIVKVEFTSHAGNECTADVVGYHGNMVLLRRHSGPTFARRLVAS